MPESNTTPSARIDTRSSSWERLKAKGWREGSVADLLGLTPEEETLIELKLDLAQAVRERRRTQGLTQTGLAEQLGSSQSRVAKIEAGDPSVSLELLVRALLTLGTTRECLGGLIRVNRPGSMTLPQGRE